MMIACHQIYSGILYKGLCYHCIDIVVISYTVQQSRYLPRYGVKLYWCNYWWTVASVTFYFRVTNDLRQSQKIVFVYLDQRMMVVWRLVLE